MIERIRKPRTDYTGKETDHYIALRSVHVDMWVVKCKDYGGEHEVEGRVLKHNGMTRKCPEFHPHNYSGLEKWDGIIRRVYGISYKEYLELIERQGGGCAICGTATDQVEGRKLAIDHCHKSNKVRGVLCSKCNQGLGAFKDSTKLLSNAIEYLKFSNAR